MFLYLNCHHPTQATIIFHLGLCSNTITDHKHFHFCNPSIHSSYSSWSWCFSHTGLCQFFYNMSSLLTCRAFALVVPLPVLIFLGFPWMASFHHLGLILKVSNSEWLSSKRTQITNVGEDVEKREPSFTVGGNVNWYSHCGKQYGGFSKD